MSQLAVPELDLTGYLPVPTKPHLLINEHGLVYNTSKQMFTAATIGQKGAVYIRETIAGKRNQLYIHRLVAAAHIGDPSGFDVDHINGCKADNRVQNLRIATRAQNLANHKNRKLAKSGFVGVSETRNETFFARICHNGKHYHIGTFPTAEIAASARDEAAKRLHGEFACTHDDRQETIVLPPNLNLPIKKSPYTGTSLHKKTGKWMANGYRAGKQYYLGLFADREDARRAVEKFKAPPA